MGRAVEGLKNAVDFLTRRAESGRRIQVLPASAETTNTAAL
jgi:hypothetical protein